MKSNSFHISKNTLLASGINYENLEFSQLLDDHLFYKILNVKDKTTKTFYLMKTIEPKFQYPEEKILKEIEILEKVYSKPSLPLIFLNYFGYFKYQNLISGSIEYNLVFENFQSSSLGKILAMNQKLDFNEIIDFFNKLVNGCTYLQSLDILLPKFTAEMFFMKKSLDNQNIEYKWMLSASCDFVESTNNLDYEASVLSLAGFFHKLILHSFDSSQFSDNAIEKLDNLDKFKEKFEKKGSDLISLIKKILEEKQTFRTDFFELFRLKLDFKKNLLKYIQIEEGISQQTAGF